MSLIKNYWKNFQSNNPEYIKHKLPSSYYFCDNKDDADECADLVINNIKRATSSSVWWYNKNNEPFPEIGDLSIVTNWEGDPKAIIKVTKVEIVKLKNITKEYAFIEGEGDKSLAHWIKVHLAYYTNEMKKHNEFPTDDMEIVCEYFEKIW